MAFWKPTKRLRANVARTQRWITVLFTDIIESTRHWNELGDIEARIQVETHDALLKAVVREFHGTLIKTIGDSLMVTFEEPDNAIRAAIAMQQQLEEERQKDPDFELKIRIGLHRGPALVEEDDVYGNTVNVASRVESEAGSGEILLSDAVFTAVNTEDYTLTRVESFTPKGKTVSLLLYRASWWREESRLEALKPAPVEDEPQEPSEPLEPASEPKPPRPLGLIGPLALLSTSVVGVVAMASKYLPSLLVDQPGWASLLLNPMASMGRYPNELAAAGVALVAVTWISLWMSRTRGLAMALLRGGASLSLVGIGSFLVIEALPAELGWPGPGRLEFANSPVKRWVQFGGEADALTAIHLTASESAPIVATAHAGERLALGRGDSREAAGWLQIHLAPQRLGWVSTGSDHERPTHTLTRADVLKVGEAEIVASACGLLATALSVLIGRWRDRLHREIEEDPLPQ